MSVPLKATNFHTTERLLELALTMLENARREQNNEQLPANDWLTNNFTLEIIRAKVAANKANLSSTSSRQTWLCAHTTADLDFTCFNSITGRNRLLKR